ncbi:hypothetical protein SteCoe_19842 [Stentor coeruleus]|uniref:Uncharacterized protein n=1 Tax=Stentor coeruleus TaxID=5963 RepID=A0A1R2BT72_9CILI|nr:hypothetical protein SteCoe_19842 [Stentor coeruleus]
MACEYLSLLENSWDHIRGLLFERMAVFNKFTTENPVTESPKVGENEEVWLMDLLGDTGVSKPLVQEATYTHNLFSEDTKNLEKIKNSGTGS